MSLGNSLPLVRLPVHVSGPLVKPDQDPHPRTLEPQCFEDVETVDAYRTLNWSSQLGDGKVFPFPGHVVERHWVREQVTGPF